MDKKKLIGIIAVVIIIIVAFVAVNQKPKTVVPVTNNTQNTVDPKKPNFVLGTVVSATATKIDFKIKNDTFSATINSDTQLLKQVLDKTTVKVVAATTADFKPNSTIVVYYAVPAQNNVYVATKIQIVK